MWIKTRNRSRCDQRKPSSISPQATRRPNKVQKGLSPNIRHVEAVINPEQIDIFSFCKWKMWMKTRSRCRINLRGPSSTTPQTEISPNKVEISHNIRYLRTAIKPQQINLFSICSGFWRLTLVTSASTTCFHSHLPFTEWENINLIWIYASLNMSDIRT